MMQALPLYFSVVAFHSIAGSHHRLPKVRGVFDRHDFASRVVLISLLESTATLALPLPRLIPSLVELARSAEPDAAAGGSVQHAVVVRREADRNEIAVARGSPFQDGR